MKPGDLVALTFSYNEKFFLRDKYSWSTLSEVYVHPQEINLIIEVDLNRICVLNSRCQLGWSFNTWFRKV